MDRFALTGSWGKPSTLTEDIDREAGKARKIASEPFFIDRKPGEALNIDRGQVYIDREAGKARKIDSEPFLSNRKPGDAFTIDRGQVYIDRGAGKSREIDSEQFVIHRKPRKP